MRSAWWAEGVFLFLSPIMRPGRVTYKALAAAWSDLGRTGPQTAWQEPEALFFPDQPFLVGRAVRESHECLASAPLCVFPAFVIELFLSISGFFTHMHPPPHTHTETLLGVQEALSDSLIIQLIICNQSFYEESKHLFL